MKKYLPILFEIMLYALLVLVNFFVLVMLYMHRYSQVDMMFGAGGIYDFIQLSKVMFMHFGVGIGILIFFYFMRKKKFIFRLLIVNLFILCSTSYFYYNFSKDIKTISSEEIELINSIKSKKREFKALESSNKFENLTFEEYQYIHEVADVPSQAYDINYEYSSDLLLGDHICNINYKVPLNVKIDTFIEVNQQSKASQSVKFYEDYKEVDYSSGSW